jgi:dihydrolipoamide dehydrogenase
MKFDLIVIVIVIVIGSGPGGYVAAIRAAQLGMKTAIVEREHLGGICLNWGCIPTKALLRSAEVYDLFQHAEAFGLSADNLQFEIASVVKRSRDVSQRLNRGVAGLLRKNQVSVIWGEATLATQGQIRVSASSLPAHQPLPIAPTQTLGPGEYSAENIIIATGARPRALPGLAPDGENIWTYFEAMVPKAIPKSLLIVGSGAIGIEFASFYRTMGAEVTVVEALEQILPLEDAEIATAARRRFERQGVKFLTAARVVAARKAEDGMLATVERASKAELLSAEKIIVAAGVQGNVEGLGLETIGVEIERGCIVTDSFGRTNVPGLFAIGDVAGPPMLAHKAEHEGVACVEAIKGLLAHPLDRGKIPACT